MKAVVMVSVAWPAADADSKTLRPVIKRLEPKLADTGAGGAWSSIINEAVDNSVKAPTMTTAKTVERTSH